jgi:hypothetical protein
MARALSATLSLPFQDLVSYDFHQAQFLMIGENIFKFALLKGLVRFCQYDSQESKKIDGGD